MRVGTGQRAAVMRSKYDVEHLFIFNNKKKQNFYSAFKLFNKKTENR